MWKQQDLWPAYGSLCTICFSIKKQTTKKTSSPHDFPDHLFNTEQFLLFGIVFVTSHV